jgi:phospholipid/cholesterol/gamma-HCH transport system ATP-binding protein
MAVVELRDISKSFEQHRVLHHVNLDVDEGTTVVILGKSGVGKSVLLKVVIGLIRPDHGTVQISGQEVGRLRVRGLQALRRNMGYLFQGAALYDSMSVRENLAFALTRVETLDDDALEYRILGQLRLVGLEDAIDKMPSELSGGMRKRVGLARALITNPHIMLYDEPTTGLDPITARDISTLIKDMQERYRLTSIAVTHDMLCARIIADKAAILNNGMLEQQGTLEYLEKSGDSVTRSFFASE